MLRYSFKVAVKFINNQVELTHWGLLMYGVRGINLTSFQINTTIVMISNTFAIHIFIHPPPPQEEIVERGMGRGCRTTLYSYFARFLCVFVRTLLLKLLKATKIIFAILIVEKIHKSSFFFSFSFTPLIILD